MKVTLASLTLVIAFCGLAIAQDTPPPAEGPSTQMGPQVIVRRPGGPGPGMDLRGPGKWWKNSALMTRIEKIFQDNRLELIDLHAALDKQEAILDPLIEADQPDESQVIAQIDKVAQARANLEKSNAQMLLAIRRVLTVDQWKKLRDLPGIATTRTGRRFEPLAPPPPRLPFPAAPPPSQ